MGQTKKESATTKSSFYDMIVYAMMIVAVVFIIIQTFSGRFTSIGFRVSLGAWILVAVSISDFVGPMMTGELQGLDARQLRLYVLASVLDAVAYMCFYIFVIFVGEWKEWTHYIYLLAAIMAFGARHVVNRMIGVPEEAKEPVSAPVDHRSRLNLQGRERKVEAPEETNDIATFRSRKHKESEQ